MPPVRLFVACTPRTGSTWFGRMLGDLLDVGANSFGMPLNVGWADIPEDGCIVVMHRRRTLALEGFLRERNFRLVAMARHPLDVLLSIPTYVRTPRNREFSALWIEGECGGEEGLVDAAPTSEAFVRYALSWRAAALFDVSTSWAARAEHASYERLVATPHEELARLCTALGATPRNDVDAVLARHNLAAFGDATPGHVWRGEPGIWRKLIVPELAHAVRERHPEAFAAFGYEADADPALTLERAEANWAQLSTGLSERTVS
jgi:hypothetical protein